MNERWLTAKETPILPSYTCHKTLGIETEGDNDEEEEVADFGGSQWHAAQQLNTLSTVHALGTFDALDTIHSKVAPI